MPRYKHQAGKKMPQKHNKKVQVGKDQEKAQSEKTPTPKTKTKHFSDKR